jgi:hypothetical protein
LSTLNTYAAKMDLRFLKGIKDFQLKATKSNNSKVQGFSDASYTMEIDKRSRTAIIAQVNKSPLGRESKQKVVAILSAEAECITLSSAFKHKLNI